jgi:glutamine amidotransferase-like uncharacterized protein
MKALSWVSIPLLISFGAVSTPAQSLRYSEQQGNEPGPSVIVLALPSDIGSVNEEAAWQISHWPVQRGHMIAGACGPVPVFGENPWPKQADAGGKLMTETSPDWLILLAEDYDFHAAIPAAYGSTITVLDGSETTHHMAGDLCSALAEKDEPANQQWLVIRQTDQQLPDINLPMTAKHMLLVTTSAKQAQRLQRVPIRLRQFRTAIGTLLHKLELQQPQFDDNAHIQMTNALRVGIYAGSGSVSSSGHDPGWIRQSLRHQFKQVMLIDNIDIASGVLDHLDVVVFGGGSSSAQGRGLGHEGRSAVRSFIENGGGYVGICAGAYLAMSSRDEYLRIIDCRPGGSSGSGVVLADFSSTAGDAIDVRGQQQIKYSGGPLIETESLPATCSVWATFAEDLARADKKPVPLAGKAAIVAAEFGDGRLVLFSPHPERWPGPQESFWNAIRWSAGEKIPGSHQITQQPAPESHMPRH